MNTLYTQAPEAKEIVKKAFPSFNGREVLISLFQAPMELRSYWDEGSKDFWAIVNLNDNTVKSIPENGTPYKPEVYRASELPLNCFIVLYHTGISKFYEIFVGQDNLTKLLPPPTELSLDEKVVLYCTRAYKSSYAGRKDNRFYEANYEFSITRERYDFAKESLQKRGLLNKAGAITTEGRNAISSLNKWTLREELLARVS